MFSLWNFCKSLCKQKRILFLLCTFGTSFIAFNSSLLSSSSATVVKSRSQFTEVEKGEQERSPESLLQRKYQIALLAEKYYPSLSKRVKEVNVVNGSNNKVFVEYTETNSLPKFESLSQTREKINPTESAMTRGGAARPQPHFSSRKTVFSRLTNSALRSVIVNANESNNTNIISTGGRITSNSKSNIYDNIKTDVALAASSTSPAGRIIFSYNNHSSSSSSNTDYTILLSSSSISPFSTSSPNRTPGFPVTSSTAPTSFYSRGSASSSNKFPFVSTYNDNSNLSPFRIPSCRTPTQLRRVQKRKKNLTVIENFIMGWKRVRCNESITYTTHGDYRYLDNLVPLVERWNGPVSLAVYAPGSDLEESLTIISYFKMCTSSKIDKWVTFHLIYDVKYTKKPAGGDNSKPGDISWLDILYQNRKWSDCSKQPTFGKGNHTFRIQNGLLYPINIARNIARFAATTHFVLASDIELYPSINLIPSFLGMLQRLQEEDEKEINYRKNRFTAAAEAVATMLFSTRQISDLSEERKAEQQPHHQQSNRHVYVLPVFEVKKEISPCQVETKQQLVSLLRNKSAVLFHHSICPQCHTFPKFDDWKTPRNNNDFSNVPTMRLFHKAKRKPPFHLWEPIFIGTKDEPIYDERLSWEGLRDKMVSGYIMCVLNYDFYILDNAFLVHKPGIRRVSHLVTKTVMSQDRLINFRIRSELMKKFGKHDECAL